MDKKELNGRVINVEIAKPPSSTKRGNVAKEAANAAGGEQSTADHETSGTGRGRGRARRGRGGRRGGRKPPADGETDGNVAEQLAGLTVHDAPESVPNVGSMEPDSGRGRGRGGRGRGRGGRPRPPPRGPPEGEDSKTLVFIANLAFSVTDESLRNIFEGYTIKSAHVVIRQRGPAAGKSKGYGFVDFGSEEEQKKAIETFNGHEVEGREIQIKVAVAPSEPLSGTIAE